MKLIFIALKLAPGKKCFAQLCSMWRFLKDGSLWECANKLFVIWILLAVQFLFAPNVEAAGDSSTGETSVGLVLLFLAFVVIAYLAAHFFVDRLQKRLLVMPGIEYILLGILLGPIVPQIRAFDDLTPLLPVIVLSAGWVGLLRGMDFNFKLIVGMPQQIIRIVLSHHFFPAVLVSFATYFIFTRVNFVSQEFNSEGLLSKGFSLQKEILIGSLMLGFAAAIDSVGSMELIQRKYGVQDGLLKTLLQAARLGDWIVIVGFGMIFCIFHENQPTARLILRPTEWVVVSIGLGLLLGLLFVPFVGEDESPNRRFLALVGIITFASGAAWFLQISPLLVNLVLGMVLANASKSGPSIYKTLTTTEGPMFLLLLVFAGAIWRPPPLIPVLVGVPLFILLRVVGKWLGSQVSAWGTNYRRDLFRGLLGQGQVTVAMAVSFKLVYDGEFSNTVYSIILVSVIVHDVLASRLLRSLLIDAGDINKEQVDSIRPLAISSEASGSGAVQTR